MLGRIYFVLILVMVTVVTKELFPTGYMGAFVLAHGFLLQKMYLPTVFSESNSRFLSFSSLAK